jgi:microsomal dipeptidase-like Zn-dependent dipeptidase
MKNSLAALALCLVAGCVTRTTTSSTIEPGGTMIVADADLYAKAKAIHDRVFTIDTHVDIPRFWSTTPANDADSGTAQVTFRKMKQGGLDGAFFAVYVGQGPRTPAGNDSAKAQAMDKFHGIHRSVDTLYKDKIELAYQPEDVPKILAKGKLVAAIGIENGYVIGRDLSLIGKYYDLGARYMTLAHTSNNDICDSSTDQRGPEHNGLSEFGRDVVREMNRVGMMVDVSHVSKQSMLQATALSTSPVVGSHSSTTAVANVPRNFDDEMLRAIAANGGVMQTVAFASYVKVFPAQRDSDIAKLNAEFYPSDSIPVWRARADCVAGRAGGRGWRRRTRRSRRWPRASPTSGEPPGGLPAPDGRDHREVSTGKRARLRGPHRPRREGRGHRPRRHQLRLRRRRRCGGLGERHRDAQRHHGTRPARVLRGADREAVGRKPAPRVG